MQTRYDLWDRYINGYDGNYGPFYDLEEAIKTAQNRVNGNRNLIAVDIVKDNNSKVLMTIRPETSRN